ncbi:lantibiotic dehydratase family protein [Chryseobacterium taiwanense]|uniref:Lantibiotic dehydratase n=1 Tax=Chryseobacterium taiwanense TaxID=363331 RepID=A0A0B4DDS8_9FLAO|nr:lantibiotic dehydratase family protein [Chryseobacterium taiwanense]KIC64801.1 lantibiotic dehydratase [Chryseobacterium taiwanense]
MSHFPYQFFEEFVVRTHLLSCKKFQEKVNKDEISDEELKDIFVNPVFQEAVYLASPSLHKELNKWINSEKVLSPKEIEKLKHTLLKYYSRISTRCTPFGLFSGVGLGKFSNDILNQLSFEDDDLQPTINNKIRDTKLDMHFLVSLAQHFVNVPEIRNKLSFYPNNSIYIVGRKIRYIEYEYNNGKREYIISSAPISRELQEILEFSKQGKTIGDIANILVNSEITQDEAIEFVGELIDNQVLISKLEPTVSGNDFLETIISALNKIGAKTETEILHSIQNKLEELDENIGNPISKYHEIEELIKSVITEYDQKYLFQTDLYHKEKFKLPSRWSKELKKAISFLNKLTLFNKDTHLSAFKKAFSERFESEEVPLTVVLDTEIGIGYKQNYIAKGVHPYLEDLQISHLQQKQNLTIHLTPVQKILNEKLQEAMLENQFSIKLSDEDFKEFQENWHDLPDTFSFMAEIISEDNEEKIYIGNGGGSSAANLLGRFCSQKSEVQDLTKTITKKEQELNSDYIVAEIIHLPEARIGNVIRRPTLRQYEIPYLAQSALPEENQIPVDDLNISLKNDKIVLRSKRLNREVKPYLTNAHNYYTNTLPIYHFLSELNSQNRRTGLYFDWGGLSHIYQFLPRVEYNNIILSKAQWKITEKEIAFLEKLINNKEEIKIWRKKRRIPQWVQLVKSDNTIAINLENNDMVKLFAQNVKSEKSVIIEEFLYNENDDFKREFVFPMYRKR